MALILVGPSKYLKQTIQMIELNTGLRIPSGKPVGHLKAWSRI